MNIRIVMNLDPDEVMYLVSIGEMGSSSRNPIRKALAAKIREAADAAHVEPDADEPLYAEYGGEAGGA